MKKRLFSLASFPEIPFGFNRFYRYLLSYTVLVVLLLLVVSGAVYGTFVKTLRQDAEDSTISMLSQIKDAVDMRSKEMNRVALQIATNPLLTPYMVTSSKYGEYQAVNELGKYRSSNDFIYDIMIYFGKNSSLLYAASGVYSVDNFFEYVYHFSDLNPEKLNMLVSTAKYPAMRPLETVSDSGRKGKLSMYVFPSSKNPGSSDETILFLIREEAWNNLLQNVLSDYKGYMYIWNENREIIAKTITLPVGDDGDKILQALQSDGFDRPVGTMKIDGCRYSVVRLTSDYNNWSYVAIMPNDQFMGKVNQTLKIFSFSVLAVFLMGMSVSVAFSIRNYKPIRNLIRMLNHRAGGFSLPQKKDEVAFIHEAIGKVTRENEGLLYELKSQARILKEKYILAFIQGKVKTRKQLDEMLRFSNLQLDKPYFAVMQLFIDDYHRFVQEQGEFMQESLKYALMKVTEELSQEIGGGWGAEYLDDRSIVVLLNIEEPYAEMRYLRELAEKVRQFITKHFHFTVTVGIGEIYSDVAMVRQSFLQAQQAIRYRFIKGGNRVICYNEMETAKVGAIWYPVEWEAKLVKAIKQGNDSQAEKAIREMMRSMVVEPRRIEEVECVCIGMINTVMRTVSEIGNGLSGYAEETMERIFVSRFETIEALEHHMVEFCRQVCRYVRSQTESKSCGLPDKLLPYIHENFRDPNISLKQLSEQFELSPSYLTRYFKDHIGVSIMRYIDMLRINEAKELLRNTDWTLREIVQHLGVADSTNFIRKFKKSEGITPIHYRNLTRHREMNKAQT